MGPNGEALMDYNVWDAVRAGFQHIVLVIRREFEREIQTHVANRWGHSVPTEFAYQGPRSTTSPKPWGTAHAVLTAADKVSGPFAVVNADDCYGGDAFKRLIAHFRTETDTHALVGYPITVTLSPNGGVSRAVCETSADGYLEGLTELHEIRDNGHLTGVTTGGETRRLTGGETVSMNIWGFQSSFIPWLETGFAAFRRTADPPGPAEYLLSDAVRDLVTSGKGRCRVLDARGAWCGVTFPEDTPWVQDHLRKLVATGRYPPDIAVALRRS
jgi:Nucleotidyl transferase